MDANAVWYIADEYGVEFLDFVSMDQVVDYATDLCDPDHLNVSGARKVSDFLGSFLKNRFQLEDRRSDSRYANWQQALHTINSVKDSRAAGLRSPESLLMLAHDNRYRTAVYVSADSPVHTSERFNRLIHNIIREHVYEEDMFSKWSNSMFPLKQLDNAQGEAYFAFLNPGTGAFSEQTGANIAGIPTDFGMIACTQEGGISGLTREDGTQEALFSGETEADLQIVILDNETGRVVRSAEFSL